jgi:hypothetical protein
MHRSWCGVNCFYPIKNPKTKNNNTQEEPKMKVNKWTMGLAAVGVISLGSVAMADEKKLSAVQTAVSSTVLSGYVDTSIQWNVGPDTANFPAYSFGGAGKADGFNLNVVKISLEKPLDDNGWAAGYKVDLLFGADANAFGTTFGGGNPPSINPGPDGLVGTGDDFVNPAAASTSAAAIKQAYVALRAPVGNGIDMKIGVFDTIIGYEVFESPNNPNFTRSWGYTIEPTTHTGLLGTYKIVDNVAISAGIANTQGPAINGRSLRANGAGVVNQTHKTYMGSIAVSAPESMGFLKGSTLYAGVIDGFAVGGTSDTVNYYLGGTLATPVAGLTLGFAIDYVDGLATGVADGSEATAYALYASFKATDKLSVHGRAEFAQFGEAAGGAPNLSVWTLTGTVQYDLWENVLARLEFRYDDFRHGANVLGGTSFSGAPVTDTAYAVIANLVYKF